MTAEEKTEIETLQARLLAIEPELRTAMLEDEAAEHRARETFTSDAQGAERRALIDGADVGAIFDATLEHRATDRPDRGAANRAGPTVKSGFRSPCSRSAAASPSNAQRESPRHRPMLALPRRKSSRRYFRKRAAAFLGIDMPTDCSRWRCRVPGFEHVRRCWRVPAENAGSQDETAGGFTADILTPGRIQASFFYSREDRARFAGMSDALRMNLSDALSRQAGPANPQRHGRLVERHSPG